jgi:Galactose binding lectin domain
VIVVTAARYGRMRLGRCVEQELGYLGCWRDVLPVADRRCSGRRKCELRVPDAELEATQPCLRELKNYLEASYVCIPGTYQSAVLHGTLLHM